MQAVILITGASEEVGQALVRHHLADGGRNRLLTLDLRPPAPDIAASHPHRRRPAQQDPADPAGERVQLCHLAALLSTSSEFTPEMATRSTWRDVDAAATGGEQSQWRQRPVQFIFPSSIAVHGLPERSSKRALPTGA
ncbi:MAG: hypothetical protein R3A10_05700 [Caldilineaceae bacterium]